MCATILYLSLFSAPLVGAETVPHKPHLVTADSEGWFKLWDLRTYKCLQTFTRDKLKHLDSFALVPQLHLDRIVCGIKTLNYFEQGADKHISAVADENPITKVYNTIQL